MISSKIVTHFLLLSLVKAIIVAPLGNSPQNPWQAQKRQNSTDKWRKVARHSRHHRAYGMSLQEKAWHTWVEDWEHLQQDIPPSECNICELSVWIVRLLDFLPGLSCYHCHPTPLLWGVLMPDGRLEPLTSWMRVLRSNHSETGPACTIKRYKYNFKHILFTWGEVYRSMACSFPCVCLCVYQSVWFSRREAFARPLMLLLCKWLYIMTI